MPWGKCSTVHWACIRACGPSQAPRRLPSARRQHTTCTIVRCLAPPRRGLGYSCPNSHPLWRCPPILMGNREFSGGHILVSKQPAVPGQPCSLPVKPHTEVLHAQSQQNKKGCVCGGELFPLPAARKPNSFLPNACQAYSVGFISKLA